MLAAKARFLRGEISDKVLGIIVTQVRKYLSTSLNNRLSFLVEGAQADAGRRSVA